MLREERMYLLSAQNDPYEAPPLEAWQRQLTGQVYTVVNAVDDLFNVLKERRTLGNRLSNATLALHRAGFGLAVYKHPRPGVVHAWSKKFGNRPITLVEEEEDMVDVGLLYSARDFYFRT